MPTWVGLLVVLLAAAQPAPAAAADLGSLATELARALRQDEVGAIAALGVPGGITTPEWGRSLRWLIETFDRFALERCAVVADQAGVDGRHELVIDLVGTASPIGQPARPVPLPRWWSLEVVPTPAGWRISSAMAREERLAINLLDATPAAREAAFDLPFVDPSTLLRALAYVGDGEAGMALDRWVVDLARRRGDLRRQATGLRALAANETWVGKTQESLTHAHEALDLAVRADVPGEIAGAWFAMGIAHWYRNEVPAAVAALLTAGAAATREDDPRQGLQALYMAAHLQASNGQLREALKTAEEMRRRLGRFSLPRSTVDLDFLLADVYVQLGDPRLAHAAYERAYAGSRALGDDSLAVMALGGLATFEDDPAVLRDLIAETTPPPEKFSLTVCLLRGRLGDVLRRRGDRAGAEAELQESLRLAREPDERRAAAAALVRLAELRLDQQRPVEALAYAREATALAEGPEGDLRLVGLSTPWTARTVLARALRALERRQEAAESLALAIDQVEQREASLPEEPLARVAFFDDNTAPYRELTDLQVDDGDAAAALATVERMRARALRNDLLKGHVDLSTSLPSEERAEESRLASRLVELNKAVLAATDDESRRRLAAERETARLAWQGYVTMLYSAHPRLRQRRSAAEEVLSWQDAIPRGGLAVEYLVGAERTLLLVSGRRPGGESFVEAIPIAVRGDDLQRRARDLNRAIAGDDPSFAAPARELYRLLLRPVERYLVSVDRLAIVPDGPLWSVPFQALSDAAGRPLVSRLATFVAPSLRMVAAARTDSTATGSRILALGNPTMPSLAARARAHERGIALGALPETEREVRDIGRLYGARRSDVWVGAAAAEGRFKAVAAGYQVLHVATHGLLDDGNPMYSALVLAVLAGEHREDGLLEAREVADLRLGANLAVLSACDTGRGHVGNGEGVVGLAWAFLAAGVPRLVVTDWKPDSVATARLMVRFHRELLAGHDAAQALRRAQLALAREPRYRHPYYWAAFFLIGDGWHGAVGPASVGARLQTGGQ